jgi:hypothetical protein
MLSKFSSAFGDTRVERVWFAVCSLLALIAVWGHRYPTGIDLPQHANLFRLWTELSDGPWEYRRMYRVELFTPYLLPYLVAYPVTKVVSALAAVKVLYSFTAVGLPLLMRRWLKTIDAEPRLALVGFVAAFGFPYIWGFFSNVVALPMVFGYLNSFERQGERPRLGRIAATAAWAVALFLSHGITFGVAMGAAGISYVLRGGWFRRWRALTHFLLPFAVAVAWLSMRSTAVNSHPIQDYLNWDRIVTLFSSAFLPFPDERYAKLALAGVLLFLLVARPRLRFSAARIAPFGLALLAFLALPDWIASTWLVGSRLSVFVHVFAVALLVPREGDVVARQWFHVLGALTLAFLIVLNVRLAGFNREMAGLDVIAQAIPKGADLETLVVRTNLDSEVFGAQQLGQTPAWITAERGGMIANDSAVSLYYQIPIKRNDVPFPTRFRYVVGHGDRRAYRNVLRAATGSSSPLAQGGQWLLYERPGFETDDFVVMRDAQGYGTLAKDRSIGGSPLEIGGTKFEHGLGAHADSFVRIRFKRAAKKLTGLCGLDANAGGAGEVVFRIRDDAGHVLFESAVTKGGAPAQAFSVALTGQAELLLEVVAPHGIAFAHADWVDLRLE